MMAYGLGRNIVLNNNPEQHFWLKGFCQTINYKLLNQRRVMPKFVHEVRCDAWSGRAKRVPDSEGAAVHIGSIAWKAELFLHR